MNKIILTLLLILSMSLTLVGCSRPDKFVGSADDETKKLLSDTISNYDLTRNIFGDNVTFDLSDVREIEGKKYIRVSGDIFENLNSYKKTVEETFTLKRSEEILNQLEDSKSILRNFDNKLYVADYYAQLPKEVQKLRVSIDSLDLITKKDNLLIVNYRKTNTGMTKVTYTDQVLLLEKENGKYLVSEDISKYTPADNEVKKIIEENYKIPEDNSTFIASNSLYLKNVGENDENTFLTLYKVFEPEQSKLVLKYSAMYNSSEKSIENLSIVNNRTVNKVFTDLCSNSSAKLLIIPIKEGDNPKKVVEFINYSDEEKENLPKYILIPKYLDENNLKISSSNLNLKDLYSTFYMGLDGNYTLTYSDSEGVLKLDTSTLETEKLPAEVEKLNFEKFNDYLGNIK
ncbi:hypothetical protein SAMN02745245_00515 [Anaerosphaera aminiphila DSM 21120]|uniref:Lipoprotein n=1 Tax=Anaerosphaera aminiphila DSM 21120 TaxID=1120995 RepID=A0A1M5Q7I6_9FIRM|nr:hypothetical protein [Anaerosphaera aminiphila]SHH09433.1 hypothetical protein SAMN02745245_00515 [Anaerosphaera aminiphila DSM 21120]